MYIPSIMRCHRAAVDDVSSWLSLLSVEDNEMHASLSNETSRRASLNQGIANLFVG